MNNETPQIQTEEKVVGPQPTHDGADVSQAVEQQQAAKAAAEMKEGEIPTRELTLRVPANVPDSIISAAWNIGQIIVANTNQGLVTIVFGTVVKDAGGNLHPQINYEQMIPAKPADVQRLLNLANTISRINVEAHQAAQSSNPVERATAGITADLRKDNATTDAVAQAQGKPGGIVIAKN
jgi:hypothetical protein